MSGGRRCPNIPKLTDTDVRHLLADGIVRACGKPNTIGGGTIGPSRVGMAIGCDEKTVRRARDQESTLGLACAVNLLDVDPSALDALLAAKGFVLTPLPREEAPDPIAATGRVITGLAEVRADGTPETDAELALMETDIEAAELSLHVLHARIARFRLGRS
jgi:hypothetical protein